MMCKKTMIAMSAACIHDTCINLIVNGLIRILMICNLYNHLVIPCLLKLPGIDILSIEKINRARNDRLVSISLIDLQRNIPVSEAFLRPYSN